MVSAVAVLAILGLIGWLIYRVVKGRRQLRAHNIAFGISVVTGIYTYAFFLNMTIPPLVKIVVSIFLGIALIILAAYLQRRQPTKPKECEEAQEGEGGIEEVIVTENTSTQDNVAVIPKEIRGWNWGAFLLTWIWGIGNKVWIALLTLIPFVGIIMVIVLGVKGSEWAWQSRRWDSIEHFKRTQSTWAKWGVVVTILSFVISLVVGFIAAWASY